MSRKWTWRVFGAVSYLAAVWLVYRGVVWLQAGIDFGAAVFFVTAAFLILRVHEDDKQERKRSDY